MMKKIILYYFTIKELKIKQIFFKIYYVFYKPILNIKHDIKIKKNLKRPINFIKKSNSFIKPHSFIFLNKKKKFIKKINWDVPHMSDLWRYNLNYFDFINQKQIDKKYKLNLINNWLTNNRNYNSIGWEPYPTSLRIVNWTKFFLNEKNISICMLRSVHTQLRWLNKKMEYHNDANHLFANLKAIIFGSILFDCNESNKWFEKACLQLDKEVKSQILNDGGHFELSPMYHSIILEDIIDIINILKRFHYRKKNKLIRNLEKKVKEMFYWLEAMSHNDRSISFFNDACDNVAPTLRDLKSYAKNIGIKLMKPKNKDFIFLRDSGFAILKKGEFKVIIDIGQIGANIQPGHAHADTLSFEASIKGNKFIVNSGISTYEESRIRMTQRSTSAHSTVEINDTNSSEIWKSFRVARRAIVFNIEFEENKDHIRIAASHQGYKRIAKNLVHRREWLLSNRKLSVYDRLSGKFNTAKSRIYFHPSVVQSSNNKIVINKKYKINILTSNSSKIRKSFYYPEFNKKISNVYLFTSIVGKDNKIEFQW